MSNIHTASSLPSGDAPDAATPSPTSAEPDATLHLSPNVYVCITQGHCVFLDLDRDKYSAIALTGHTSASHSPPLDIADHLLAHRDQLLAAGLLTADPASAKPLAATTIEAIDGHIFGFDDQRAFGLTGEAAVGLKITLGEMFDFFWASWTASRDLKTKHIAKVIEKVRRRKAEAGHSSSNIEDLRRLTAVFRRLRPWYSRRYLCLYDSLALIHFLATHGIFPLWVFAVQAQPFGAHCWIQDRRLLLNEGTEYAGQFTPIMVV